MPSFLFVTDDRRVKDPAAIARRLPHCAGILLRHRNEAERARWAAALMPVVRARKLFLLIAGDEKLARRVHAHGLHLPETRGSEAVHWRACHKNWHITIAAHSERALLKAALWRADAALLAPIFPTKSHANAKTIGVLRARLIAARAPLPVYALGGVGEHEALRLHASHFAGFAAAELFLDED